MKDPTAKPSDPGSAESWVDEIVNKDKESTKRQKAADAPRKARNWLPVLIPLTLVCVGLTIWNPGRRATEAPRLAPIELDAASTLSVNIGIGIVEAYRDSTGRLPTTLAQAVPYPLGVDYTLSSNGTYTLSAGPPGKRVHYRSNGPRPDITRSMGPLAQEVLQ